MTTPIYRIQIHNLSNKPATYFLLQSPPLIAPQTPSFPIVTAVTPSPVDSNGIAQLLAPTASWQICGFYAHAPLGDGVHVNWDQAVVLDNQVPMMSVVNNTPGFEAVFGVRAQGAWAQVQTDNFTASASTTFYTGLAITSPSTQEVLSSAAWEVSPGVTYTISEPPPVFYVGSNASVMVGDIVSLDSVGLSPPINFSDPGTRSCVVKQMPNGTFEVASPLRA